MDKIICLGKNYNDHIKEMQEDKPELPVLFLKPQSSFVEIKNNSQINLPWERGEIHHECEIVLKLYKKMVIGIGIGLDLTLREVQKDLKAKGHPWEVAKVFKNSAICSPIYGIKDFDDWTNTTFRLLVNDEVKQESKLSAARLTPNEIIHHIDKYFPLCDGDLVFTGTPSGVGPLKQNDLIQLQFGPIDLTFKVV